MFTVLLIAVLAASLSCALILATNRWHLRYTGDATNDAVQKLHSNVVPRIGGIGIFVGLLLGTLAIASINKQLTLTLLLLIACFAPVYLTGFAEDITKQVSPTSRYIAAALSGLLVSTATDLRITQVDVWGADALLTIPVIGILFFVFAVASVSHAFNLIDGQNGLCAGITVICCVAIAWQSHLYNLNTPMALAALCAAANLGFLLFNFPLGKIFLGDAGAYLNGSVVAVTTVQLIQGSGELSPWYAVALLVYPIWETLFSMWRRIQAGRSFSEPDLEHLHSLYYKSLRDKQNFGLWARSSAPALWVLSAIFIGAATLVAHSTALCIAVVMTFCASYVLLYKHAQRTHSAV